MPVQFDPFRGFETGAAIGGTNAFGTMIRTIMDRVRMADEQRFAVQGEVEKERALMPLKVQLAKEQAQAQSQFLGGGDATLTGYDVGPAGTTTHYSTPGKAQAVIDETTARESATRQAQMGPIADSFRKQLGQMIQLQRSVPAPKAGPFRLAQGAATTARSYVTGNLPQLEQYDRKRKSVAGLIIQLVGGERSTRLTDEDVKRALGLLSQPAFDTEDLRHLSNVDLMDALNSIPEVRNLGGVRLLDNLTPDEIIRARELQNPKRGRGQFLRDPAGNVAIEYPDGTLEELP